jgi:hypothetical protein
MDLEIQAEQLMVILSAPQIQQAVHQEVEVVQVPQVQQQLLIQDLAEQAV